MILVRDIKAAVCAHYKLPPMLSEDGSKLLDRDFHEEFARRYERWRKLFLMGDA